MPNYKGFAVLVSLFAQLLFLFALTRHFRPPPSLLFTATAVDICIANNQHAVVLLPPEPGAELPVLHRAVQSWICRCRTPSLGARVSFSGSWGWHIHGAIPRVLPLRV